VQLTAKTTDCKPRALGIYPNFAVSSVGTAGPHGEPCTAAALRGFFHGPSRYDGSEVGLPSRRAEAPVSRPHVSLPVLLLLAACAGSGCAGVRHAVPVTACCGCDRGLVLVADGAGGFEGTSAALRQAVADEGLPLCVETAAWSHGYGRGLADQIDYCY